MSIDVTDRLIKKAFSMAATSSWGAQRLFSGKTPIRVLAERSIELVACPTCLSKEVGGRSTGSNLALLALLGEQRLRSPSISGLLGYLTDVRQRRPRRSLPLERLLDPAKRG
jgi:hypothetical protein